MCRGVVDEGREWFIRVFMYFGEHMIFTSDIKFCS